MAQQEDPKEHSYPTGRGYGNDYMRGGEVLGGYGYSARSEYERRRGELGHTSDDGHAGAGGRQGEQHRRSDDPATRAATDRPSLT